MKFFKLLKSLWIYLKKDKTKIIVVISLIVISSLIGLTYGYLNGAAVEAITKVQVKAFLTYLSLYFLVLLVGNQFLRRSSRIILNKIELDLTREISFNLFKKIGKLPAKAFEEKTSGEMINRITNDAETITDMLNQLLNMLIEIFGSFIIIFYVFYNSWIVGLEIVVYVSLIAFVTSRYTPKIKEYNKTIKTETDGYIADVNQSILGIREIKALGIRNNINKNIQSIINSIFKKRTDLLDYETKYTFLIKTLNILLEVGVFVTCGLLMYYKMSNLTFFIAMTYYVYRYMWIVESYSSFITIYQKVIVAMERIDEVLGNKLYEDEKYGNVNPDNIHGDITFKDVKFGYDKDTILLKDFDVTFNTGKKIAIVGKSGQGKSTIFNLLLRYFEPVDGEIYIDNIKLEDLTEEALRKHVSIIRQDPFLFNKTLKENFEILDSNITIEEIRKYCKIAEIDEYVMSLPDQYNTKIGEGGVNLSGGQKQRVAIARVLAKKSKIVLFDEATSALDNQSQACINKAIEEIVHDHTVIIIAHRLSTIMDADEIYIIDNGRILAVGSHDELINGCELYKELYSTESI